MELKWSVLKYDINKKKVIDYNIFNNIKVREAIQELDEKYHNVFNATSFEEIKEFLELRFRSAFWIKIEYETIIGNVFTNDINELEKIDIYRQIEPNLDNIVHLYIMSRLS